MMNAKRWVCIFVIIVICLSSNAWAATYALLVSGGHPYYKNFLSFTVGMAEMYNRGLDLGMNITVLDGDGPDNLIPMYSDGDPPEIHPLGIKDSLYIANYWIGDEYVKSDGGTDSADDYDRDGVADVDGPATFEALQQECLRLQNTMTPADDLFVFLGLHGRNDPEQGYQAAFQDHHLLGITDGGDIAEALDSIPFTRRAVFLLSCHGGAFADDLDLTDTVLLTSTSANEVSYLYLPDAFYWGPRDGEFDNNLDKSILGAFMDALDGYADLDGNEMLSWQELYDYVVQNDPFGPILGQEDMMEYPQLFDPNGLAESTYWYVPEPATVLTLLLGGALLCGRSVLRK